MPFNSSFFIDSADVGYIQEKYALLSNHMSYAHQFFGITTNPRIMQKAGVTSLSSYFSTIQNVINFLYSIPGNNYYTLFIQPLDFEWSKSKVIEFVNQHLELLDPVSDKVGIGCKLSPNFNKIPQAETTQLIRPLMFDGFNITGITTGQELLLYSLLGYNINYVSLLTGRMEEVGIDPYPQLNFAAKFVFSGIISGSLRTFKQLEKTVSAGAIPTLGNSILDQLNPSTIDEFVTIMNSTVLEPEITRPPHDTIEPHLNLSNQFLDQMNTIGRSIYNG